MATTSDTFADYFNAFVAKFPVLEDLQQIQRVSLRYTFYRGGSSALILLLSDAADENARATMLSLKHEAVTLLIGREVGPDASGTLARSFTDFFKGLVTGAFTRPESARETFYAGASAALLLVTDHTTQGVDAARLEALVEQITRVNITSETP